ncbi:glycosyltransferase family 1 protein [Singulisphaera acidiphila]|uniref:Uncharacterized protein n=1 Tax=Singulisphaera acidiphila (strain ATCC BAA-1392 / DSM 18658 / VKM B-2454 / MOB10) TaxID=886293 RepID=L0D8Q0_SINAD|nr:glycosyltransferase family 1 protein [Singulisphaera acidiphila]AGA25612.1 hypothetical protein Sinac_1223 [Singulisphaera acidiphila DSM 18658]
MFDSNPQGAFLNIDPELQPTLNHRSGWAFALEGLAPLHNPRGVLFDGFVERTFSWVERFERRRGRIPYREPWIGFVHNPPGVPRWHDYQSSPQAILERESFRESLPYCLGLFTLSEYLRRWLALRVPVPVGSLIHPTEVPLVRFSRDAFLDEPQPAVIQVGWWLRRLHSIHRLRAGRYRKVMLAVTHRYFQDMLRRDREQSPLTGEQLASVEVSPFVPHEEYDRLLSRSVVFCDLIDSSANNIVIECMARDTPILVNRLPAVEEYLGRDYPLFFSTLDEAAEKLARKESILAAHDYLRGLSKGQFSQHAFRESLLRSEVYRLAGLASRHVADLAGPALGDGVGRLCVPGLILKLSRAASGEVYVEGAAFEAAEAGLGTAEARVFQGLVCGLSLAAVRRLTPRDVACRLGPGQSAEAGRLHDALSLALARL